MERLEICDKDDTKNPKIITLENCVKITHEPAPANLIHIVTKTDTLTLNALNEDDLKEWVAALQMVAFRDKAAHTQPTRNSVIEEDNDLYCTSYSDGMFTIKLVSSDISVKCNLEAKMYILHLTATDLQLKSADDNTTLVAKWPYRYIRKYGYRDGKFTFEAGRKCDTGEGVFSLEHSNPQEVFRCMAAKMKSMKKLINGDSMASLDCGEHQFNAALSMEAGSRSPLPPSPNHHSHSESDLNQSGHLIRGFLSSTDSLNNVSISSTGSSTPLILKHIPNKPPRKSIGCIVDVHDKSLSVNDRSYEISAIRPTPKQLKFNKYTVNQLDIGKSSTIMLKTPPTTECNKTILTVLNNTTSSITTTITTTTTTTTTSTTATTTTTNSTTQQIEPLEERPPELPIRNESKNCEDRDYECIESIHDAWRTRGIDDIKHTEHHFQCVDDDLPEFVWQRSQSQKEIISNRNNMLSPVLVDIRTCNEDYDRLQFFATKSSSSSTKPSSDYKTIVTITPPGGGGYKKQMSQPITSNDYEIIGSPPDVQDTQIQSCRLADDSYMGYGILRKTTNISPVPLPPPPPSSTTPLAPLNQTIKSTLISDDEMLDHRKYNGLDYAIVSKPKRV